MRCLKNTGTLMLLRNEKGKNVTITNTLPKPGIINDIRTSQASAESSINLERKT